MNEVEKLVSKLAYEEYPENYKKDIDGDWWDLNESKRDAFIAGCYKMIEKFSKSL